MFVDESRHGRLVLLLYDVQRQACFKGTESTAGPSRSVTPNWLQNLSENFRDPRAVRRGFCASASEETTWWRRSREPALDRLIDEHGRQATPSDLVCVKLKCLVIEGVDSARQLLSQDVSSAEDIMVALGSPTIPPSRRPVANHMSDSVSSNVICGAVFSVTPQMHRWS